MKVDISKEWLMKSTTAEDKLPVSAGSFSFYSLAEEKRTVSKKSEKSGIFLSVFSRLIKMRRRERGLTIEHLAQVARVDLDELVGIEQVSSYVPELRTIGRLAEVLGLPHNKLLQLAGCTSELDESLTEESIRFAARLDTVEKLTSAQKNALDHFVRFLEHSGDDLPPD